MNNRTLALWAGLLLSAAAANAEVYKWTDAQGNTHYGDRQPEGIAAEALNVRTGGSGQPARMAPERANPSDESTAENSDEAESEAQQIAENCEVARENLEVLANNSRIQVEEDGNRRYLEPEEIETRQAEYQQLVDTHCST